MSSSFTRRTLVALALAAGIVHTPAAGAAEVQTGPDSLAKVFKYASCAISIIAIPETGGTAVYAAVATCGNLLFSEA
jgi:hypothetical protein